MRNHWVNHNPCRILESEKTEMSGKHGTPYPNHINELVVFATVALDVYNAPALHVLNISKELANLGVKITLVAPRPVGELAVSIADVDVQCHYTTNVTRWRLPNSLNTLAQLAAVWRFRKKKRLYLRSSPLSLPLMAFARAVGFHPVVLEINGWIFDEVVSLGYGKLPARLFEFLQTMEARLAHKIRVVTPGLGQVLKEKQIQTDKIEVIGNATNLQVFRPLEKHTCRSMLSLAPAKSYLAFVGNLWPPIDLEVVFKAMKQLEDSGDEHAGKIELLIVGDGVSAGALRDKTRSVGVEARVHFLGSRCPEQANVVLGAADIAVAPFHVSRNERIGLSALKLFDYAAAAKPIVASDISGIREFSDQPWIRLFTPGDTDACAKAISSFFSTDLQQCGDQARIYAEGNFGWNRRAMEINSLFTQ